MLHTEGGVALIFIYVLTALAVLVSSIANYKKTIRAFRMAGKKLLKILPTFLYMLILVSITLTFVSDDFIMRHIGGEGFLPVVMAGLIGTVTMMPGFVAFPLCGILLEKGVSYMTLAAFTTTLMMVGVETFPVERRFLGLKAALLHNFVQNMAIAILVALGIGLAFGELM